MCVFILIHTLVLCVMESENMEAHVVRFSLSIGPSKNQLTMISSIVKKNDCVVCLPTGHRKSLIFDILNWYFMLQKKFAKNSDSLFNIDQENCTFPYFPIWLFLLILSTPVLYHT